MREAISRLKAISHFSWVNSYLEQIKFASGIKDRACPLCGRNLLVKLADTDLAYCIECFSKMPWRELDRLRLNFYFKQFDKHFMIICPFYYQANLRNIVRQYKFHQAKLAAEILGNCLSLAYWRYYQALQTNKLTLLADDLTKPDCVTWVPLHPKREKERSYDQARLLAEQISQQLKIPCWQFLERSTYTLRQSSLKDRQSRLENVKTAFRVKLEIPTELTLDKLNILLVDDVVSTGASMGMAAKQLLSIGVAGVLGLGLASNLVSEKIYQL